MIAVVNKACLYFELIIKYNKLKTKTMWKDVKCIMLPTRSGDSFPILKNINGKGNNLYVPTSGYYYTEAYLKESEFEANHLYIISPDEEIKDYDWYISKENKLLQFTGRNILGDKFKSNKVIATTDKLTIDIGIDSWIIPSPSQSFIDKYISEYNKGNVIEDVEVEYNHTLINNTRFEDSIHVPNNFLIEVLKISKDNFISLRRKETKLYTREEHCVDMQYYMEYCQANGYVTPMKWLDELKHY